MSIPSKPPEGRHYSKMLVFNVFHKWFLLFKPLSNLFRATSPSPILAIPNDPRSMEACHFFFTASLRIINRSFSSPPTVPKGPELTMSALLWSTEGMGHCWSLIKSKSSLAVKFLTFYSFRSFSSPMQSTDTWVTILFGILGHLARTCLHRSSH